MPDPFANIAPVYANIISEAKGRLKIVERTLSGSPPKDAMDFVAISDLCCLQFRKAFEAIALGCLVVHDLPGTKRLKDDTYRADKLLKSLAKLHPDFYPQPCTITYPGKTRMRIGSIKKGWLTRDNLQKYYFEFDHEMHVGTLTRRLDMAQAVSPKSLREILVETKTLILTHWINLIDGSRVLCDASKELGPIDIQVLTPE